MKKFDWRETGKKRCPRCEEVKPLSEWSIRKTGKRKGHPAGRCKVCLAELNAIQRANRKPDHYVRHERPSKLRRQYGIEPEDYDRILKNQDGKCAICGSADPKGRFYKGRKLTFFPVDHDHVTGRVRGLLCSPCNRALGLMQDDIQRLLKAAEYLQKNMEIPE